MKIGINGKFVLLILGQSIIDSDRITAKKVNAGSMAIAVRINTLASPPPIIL